MKKHKPMFYFDIDVPTKDEKHPYDYFIIKAYNINEAKDKMRKKMKVERLPHKTLISKGQMVYEEDKW